MSHTKGKLSVGNGSEYQPETVIYIDDKMGSAIANCLMTYALATRHDEMKANARRLVACWNVCDGLSTEALEIMPDTLNQVFSMVNTRQENAALKAEVERLRKQIMNKPGNHDLPGYAYE